MRDTRTGDGFDQQMQTNHLSHFLLTSLLMPSLERAAGARGQARVVNHSSGARSHPKTPLTAKYLDKCDAGTLGGDGIGPRYERYHQSANPTFCRHRCTVCARHIFVSSAAGVGIRSKVACESIS